MTSLATIPSNMEVEAQFLAKEDGIVAGISLAEIIFHEVDPSLKVLILTYISLKPTAYSSQFQALKVPIFLSG